jgi:predicted dehydrogenase
MRVTIVGLGVQGKKRLRVAGPDVVAVVDPFVATANHRRIEEVPLDSYDAAIVCTPDAQKIDVLSYLLRHGKHVLVEKPLVSGGDAPLAELARLAEQSGATCWTAYNHRFEPNLVRLREVIQSDILGEIYHARFFYGNGTAADVRQSPWRDRGLGVIADLGSHLLDLTDFLLGVRPTRLAPWSCHRFENRSYDHVLLGTEAPLALQYEMSLLSWRNAFFAEITGEEGSAHVHGLCKWGPSHLIVRHRLFPSGKPVERVETLEKPDPTWETEYTAFKQMCGRPCHAIEKDRWINRVLTALEAELRPAVAA